MQNLYRDSESYNLSLVNFFEGMEKQYLKAQKKYKRRLSKFFKDLRFRYDLQDGIKRQTDRYLASDFNLTKLMIEFTDRYHREPIVSKLISKLLKPKGAHGQQDRFLEEFINEVAEHRQKLTGDDREFFELMEILDFSEAKVKTESEIDSRKKIDILIEFESSKFAIGIENKPWAEEGEDQLSSYNRYLKNKWKDKYILIFLHGGWQEVASIRRKEKEELKSKGRFLEVSYNNFLKPWLIRCYKECEAEKVRWFLEDFITWVEDNFKVEEVEEDERERHDKKLSARKGNFQRGSQ